MSKVERKPLAAASALSRTPRVGIKNVQPGIQRKGMDGEIESLEKLYQRLVTNTSIEQLPLALADALISRAFGDLVVESEQRQQLAQKVMRLLDNNPEAIALINDLIKPRKE